MIRRSSEHSDPIIAVELTAEQKRQAITKLERRVSDLNVFDVLDISSGDDPAILALEASIEETLEAVFGARTTAYNRYKAACDLDCTVYRIAMYPGDRTTVPEIRTGITNGIQRAVALLEQAVVSLKEGLESSDETNEGRVLKAYDGMELHSEIARAASGLYRDGHYANAIENAVKALNALVRLRSGRDDLDGTTLMETVFSPKAPVLRFNSFSDQSDRDEQKGFMMLFSGAVAGLRNPRAHKLIQDNPEEALEFIAFVSLLAKLLDKAQ